MADSNIEWTDKVWNPVTGCTKVSQGCKHCYAEGVAERFFAKQYPPNQDGSPRKFTDVRCHEDRLADPLHWRKPVRIFVNSMSDLFHEAIDPQFIARCFAVMAIANQHTYQILTKRPLVMQRLLSSDAFRELIANFVDEYAGEISPCLGHLSEDLRAEVGWPLPNAWLGVSVEDQKTADERVTLLRQTPAAVRWASYEPALDCVDWERGGFSLLRTMKSPSGTQWPGLDWIVCGGESGPGARSCDLDWLRSTVRQCQAAGVRCFVKQLGARPVFGPDGWDHMPSNDGIKQATWNHDAQAWEFPIIDRKGGDINDWPADLRVREYPKPKAVAA